MDLSGKIVFKVRLDKEIKKLVIHNDDINYNELLLMMQRIFSDKIKPLDEISIKYTDEENDLITLSNDSDVLLALQNSKILKLTIFLNTKEEDVEELKPADIVKELQNIRLSIDNFLVKFDTLLRTDRYKPKVEELSRTIADASATKLQQHTNGNNINTILNAHKEFDPLSKKNESNDVIKPPSSVASQKRESRAHTPDSVGSLEFSPNPKKYDQFNHSQLQHQQQQQQQQQQPQHQFSNLNLNSLNGNNTGTGIPPDANTNKLVSHNGVHDSNNSQLFNQQQQHHQQGQFQSYNNPQQQQQVPPMQIPPQMHHQQVPPVPQQQQVPPPPSGPVQAQFYPGGPGQPGLKTNQGMPFVGNAPNPTQISAPLDPMSQQQQMYQQHQIANQQQQQQQQPPPNWHLQQQQAPIPGPGPNSSQIGFMPQQQQQQQQQPSVNNNPYAKPPNASAALLHRPASTTIYQQGYK